MRLLPKIIRFTLFSSMLLIALPSCQYFVPSNFDKSERTPGNKVDDQIIKNKILKEIKSKNIDEYSHVNVNTYNAIVLITGEADSPRTKQKFTDIASAIYKVRKTYNVMRISAPSSLVARSSDSVITGSIKTQLFRFPETRSSKVKVVTEDGVVYLMGLVSENEATKIVRTASGVSGVQKIVKLFEITK